MATISALLVIAAVGTAGCGASSALPACAPGQGESCPCGNAPTGIRWCSAAGAYGACSCQTDVDGAAGSDAGSADAGSGAGGAIVTPAMDAPANADRTVDLPAVADGPDADGGGHGDVDGATPDSSGSDGATDSGACPGCAAPPSLTLTAQHLLADTKRKLIYATVAGSAVSNPNMLVVIDPATRTIRQTVSLGSDPGVMAISDDASTLWVGIDGTFSIRRVDLTTDPPTPGAVYGLPTSTLSYKAVAGPMAVLAGTTNSVAVSLNSPGLSPAFGGLVVLDDGVLRTMRTPAHTGAARMVRGQDGRLYGFNNEHTGFGFYSVAVNAMGVTQTEFTGLISGFYTDILYADSRVYATSGEVVDVSNPAMPVRAGRFSFSGALLVRPATKRAVMIAAHGLGSSGAVGTLRVLDTERFVQMTSFPLPTVTEDNVHDLVSPDDSLLVFAVGSQFGAATRIVFLTPGTLP